MYFFLMYNLSTKAHEGPQQPTKADTGPQRWKTAHRYVFSNTVFFKIYNLFTKAHEGPQQPTKLNAGPQRHKESPRRPTATNGEKCTDRFFYKFRFRTYEFHC